ncbi:MAG: hybrid sensor histidine kinase/response regulator [Deltaproteobacteria bacterium]|nr:hybrid sensor histidine kinase/response regulator [Deltaproteobacteria bacterium]
MKILIVDDERIQLESLKRGLRSVGYSSVEASSGYEALVKLNDPDSGIDMVITDYAMPGMNGLDILKKVRERSRSLPVIMMTAYGEKSLIIEALRNECDSFIEKPFIMDDLVREIETARVHWLHNTNSHELAVMLPKLIHQINNPLSAILGSAELGMQDLGDARIMKKRLDRIIEATKKIQAINDHILHGAESHRERVERIEINPLIEECLAMFQDLMTIKKILLEKSLGCVGLHVSGYRDGLEQALKNLILNAIDSMDGKLLKRLKVKAEVSREISGISIEIEDTGCGIPPDALGKVFDPYFTSKKNGTGLGLGVVKEMVERSGGNVFVDSRVDIGTTFSIHLPVITDKG